MILAEQRFTRTETDLRQTGYMALIESLGYTDAIRFLVHFGQGQGDYIEWQDRMFGEMTVDELYQQASTHWQQRDH
jgi:hypothetical protein